MAISLTGKFVIAFVTLAVIGGLTAVIVLLVTESDEEPVTVPTTTSTQAPPIDPDALHVGVGIADMTGPCVEITFVSDLL